MNDGGHMNGMGGMSPPTPPGAVHHRHMMMHMTFFWGKNTEILFTGWPGYDHPGHGLLQTLMYAIRIALAYIVMLAVMSFNGGVFLVAVAGHTVGFFVFGSRVFKKQSPPPEVLGKTSDLPRMSCC
ncbi:Copper transporter 6 [Abeliophyllum distichum]|uniref:Copper transport protein n=1 Tax=Abeliophyllum distichum TaxID=126358 RepID=A0ABD1RF50_9LAMI